jgi:hypothetical protein
VGSIAGSHGRLPTRAARGRSPAATAACRRARPLDPGAARARRLDLPTLYSEAGRYRWISPRVSWVAEPRRRADLTELLDSVLPRELE